MYHQWDGGKAAFRFWSRFHQNCGCHGNRKLPLTSNWENDVSTLTPSVLIRSLSNLQVTRTGITSRTTSNFGQFGPLPLELGALERLIISHGLIMEKGASKLACSFVKLAGNQDRHKISDVRIPAGSDQSFWSYVPLSAKNPYIYLHFRT